MTAIGRKYGLLVLPVNGDDKRTLDLAPGRTWRGRVADMVDAARVENWRTWLGSVDWEEMIAHEHRLVLLTVESLRPDVLDAENQELAGELNRIWRALLLAAPRDPMQGEAWFFTGASDPTGARLMEVRNHGRFGPVVRPYYTFRKSFWRNLPRADRDDWLGRWVTLVADLRAHEPSLPDLIRFAVLSFEEAHRQEPIEFRLPTFVRATEAVLAIPKNVKGGAAKAFANRILRLAPHLAQHWHLGVPDLATRLEALYQHRNDCVHGKVPFLALRANGDAGADEAAWYEHLAEVTARDALLAVLRSPALLSAAKDRGTLEAAWDAGAVP